MQLPTWKRSAALALSPRSSRLDTILSISSISSPVVLMKSVAGPLGYFFVIIYFCCLYLLFFAEIYQGSCCCRKHSLWYAKWFHLCWSYEVSPSLTYYFSPRSITNYLFICCYFIWKQKDMSTTRSLAAKQLAVLTESTNRRVRNTLWKMVISYFSRYIIFLMFLLFCFVALMFVPCINVCLSSIPLDWRRNK